MSTPLIVLLAFCWCAACLTTVMVASVIATGMRLHRAELDMDAVSRVVEETARAEADRAVAAARQMAQNALQRADDALERAERAQNAVAARAMTRK